MSMMQMLLGTSAGGAVTIADAFSTHLYTGNGSTQTITNGINLSGEGGLVWNKCRSFDHNHFLTDTVRGVNSQLQSNKTDAASAATNRVTGFSNNGFTLGDNANTNQSGQTFASWTFRKAPGFFDVVTYTGNGSSGLRSINHNLGSTPAFIIIKYLDGGSQWYCWHEGLTSKNYYILLNDTGAEGNAGTQVWDATDTTFSIHSGVAGNGTGNNYVAYLFAGDTPDMIKCGSYTGNGGLNNGPTVTLGFEPQWVLIKSVEVDGQNWNVADSARGFTTSVGATNGKELRWNSADSEVTRRTLITSSTGFQIMDSSNEMSGTPSKTYIYMAIAAP